MPLVILRHIKNMEANSSQIGHFRRFFYPLFANCVHTKTMFVHVSKGEIFSLTCSKFAVECDWNSRNSQNVQNFCFFRKNLETFQNRYMWQIFSRMRLKWFFSLKICFHLIVEVFWQKSEKNRSWKS